MFLCEKWKTINDKLVCRPIRRYGKLLWWYGYQDTETRLGCVFITVKFRLWSHWNWGLFIFLLYVFFFISLIDFGIICILRRCNIYTFSYKKRYLHIYYDFKITKNGCLSVILWRQPLTLPDKPTLSPDFWVHSI